ncbi:hypothetical protein ACGFY6_29375 [Streptomyces sp. NPDC048387]|uniref:hypothetical protein n=1 Tax=Streptomyces sp. NPDC048387 TaxID=3365542 RepID=UPI0037120964
MLFETQDESEFRAYIRHTRESNPQIDWSAVRIDNFCGHLEHANTHRLSLFVPHPRPDPSQNQTKR